jgi:plastocyanin domain-containing protein
MRFVLAAALLLSACSKKADAPAAKPADQPAATAATAATNAAAKADGPRVIAIEAGKDGYVPDKIAGKAGEKLDLRFTRTIEGDCLASVKFADKSYELPMNKPVDVPVTVPASGELTFVCAMDMFKGTVVVAN